MALAKRELDAVSKQYFDDAISQEAYEESVFFSKLKKDKKIITDGGTLLQWPVRYKKLDKSGAVDPREQIVFEQVDTRTAAQLDWTYHRGQTIMFWDEMVKNQGEGKIIDLLKDKAQELKEDFQDHLYSQLFNTSPGATDMASLALVVDSTSSYAGISPSDASAWAAVEDSSTTTFSLDWLRRMVTSAQFGKSHPTLHITTRELKDKLEQTLVGQTVIQNKEISDLGFDNISFKGAAVVGDAFVPAGYWYGLDMEKFEFRVNKGNDMVVSDWEDGLVAGYPKSLLKYMLMVGNLMCRSRQTSFKATALDYTK